MQNFLLLLRQWPLDGICLLQIVSIMFSRFSSNSSLGIHYLYVTFNTALNIQVCILPSCCDFFFFFKCPVAWLGEDHIYSWPNHMHFHIFFKTVKAGKYLDLTRRLKNVEYKFASNCFKDCHLSEKLEIWERTAIVLITV